MEQTLDMLLDIFKYNAKSQPQEVVVMKAYLFFFLSFLQTLSITHKI